MEEKAKQNKPLIQSQVISYLEDNPDFFLQHPELLDQLNLSHPSGDATSLIEHQVKRLQAQNLELNQQLRQLVQIATENEQLMTELHQLTLQLIPLKSLPEFFHYLVKEMDQRFNTEKVFIGVFGALPDMPPGLPVRKLDTADPELKPFGNFLDNHRTTCGRLSKNKVDFLFGPESDSIQSCALVPLGSQSEYGMLAIGSKDPAKFFPGMGTLFLDLLGDVISNRLMVSEIAPKRQSA